MYISSALHCNDPAEKHAFLTPARLPHCAVNLLPEAQMQEIVPDAEQTQAWAP